ncbi:hypothetical protein ACGFNU_23405 [Spirillospora sp. NPDC048911]|uniref:hypothetical protein n=1 Tax=Spirillospora sp. NPDC048911 TaxID=3364527 RepID=UPI00370FAB5F
MAMTTQQITAKLTEITDRIAACFDESADKWTADRQLTLEDVERRLLALVDRLEENAGAHDVGC